MYVCNIFIKKIVQKKYHNIITIEINALKRFYCDDCNKMMIQIYKADNFEYSPDSRSLMTSDNHEVPSDLFRVQTTFLLTSGTFNRGTIDYC
jgi:hypothetical protein